MWDREGFRNLYGNNWLWVCPVTAKVVAPLTHLCSPSQPFDGSDDVSHPVSYFSVKFRRHQLNYSTIEKETLAMLLALQHFKVYLGSTTTAALKMQWPQPLCVPRPHVQPQPETDALGNIGSRVYLLTSDTRKVWQCFCWYIVQSVITPMWQDWYYSVNIYSGLFLEDGCLIVFSGLPCSSLFGHWAVCWAGAAVCWACCPSWNCFKWHFDTALFGFVPCLCWLVWVI